MDDHFASVLREFPPVDLYFLYGSGIFHQEGYTEKDMKNAMVDIIFSVNDPMKWHEQNIDLNPHHYSFCKIFPNRLFNALQSAGGGIFFNTLIKLHNGMTVKYGVVSNKDLINDLEFWTTFYLSGRLQKPVKIMKCNPIFNSPLRNNLLMATHASLLLLPEKTTLDELLLTISGLSYKGDVRMGIAENPNKVKNIVKGNYDRFKQLYEPIVMKIPEIQYNNNTHDIIRDTTWSAMKNLIRPLPLDITEKIYLSDIKKETIEQAVIQKAIRKKIMNHVRYYSACQSAKGFVTNGFSKSSIYLGRKIMKFLGRK